MVINIHRAVPETDALQLEQARDPVRVSREVLKNPRPDTFLGRNGCDPLKEKDVRGWINSKELQPPSA
jgi:hypothetical protein